MSFGMFEANVTSEDEEKRQVREASNKLAAATYDVRERFGHFLFAARDLAEYNDRLALSKTDILKTIEPHVFPRTGTVRRVLKPLESEFKSLRSRTAMRRHADEDDLFDMLAPGIERPASPGLKENPFADGGFDPSKIPGVTGGPNTPKPDDPTGGLLSPPDPAENPGLDGLNTSPPGGPAPAAGAPAAAAPTVQGPTPAASADPVTDSAGTGGGDWTPNGNTDSIGAGDYEIQAGDTLTSISDRSGVSVDDLASSNGIADPDMIYAGDSLNIGGGTDDSAATDTASDSAPLAAEAPDVDVASPAPSDTLPTSGVPNPLGDSSSPAALTSQASRRRAAARRRADFERNLDTDITYHPHEGELEPEGDFKGYLKSVDQGAEGKADHNFGGTFPGGSDHDMDPAKTDFVKGATRRFASWCQYHRLRPTLASLDSYAPSDREYIAIAADLQRLSKPIGPEWNSKGKPKPMKPTKPAPLELHESPDPEAHWSGPQEKAAYIRLCRQAGVRPTVKGFRAWAGKHDSPWNEGADWLDDSSVADPAELVRSEYDAEPPMMKRVKNKGKHQARRRQAGGFEDWAKEKGYPSDTPASDDVRMHWHYDTGTGDDEDWKGVPKEWGERGGYGKKKARRRESASKEFRDMMQRGREKPTEYTKQLQRDIDRRNQQALRSGPAEPGPVRAEWEDANPGWQEALKPRRNARRRTAAPDYLQKADEALTNLLNQKAEEFQQTIAPLQQALQTVQQAEQEAAAANPMNVLPPAGTVNVLPGQDAGGAGGAAGGGMDPSALMGMMGGGDPSMGGGDPMAAMMGGGGDPSQQQPPQQQMMARRGKARGGASPRTAKNVEELWDNYTQQETLRGGEPDVDSFAQKYRVGPKALQRIRQKAMGG